MRKMKNRFFSFVMVAALIAGSIPLWEIPVAAQEETQESCSSVSITTEEIEEADAYLEPTYYELDMDGEEQWLEGTGEFVEIEGASFSTDNVTEVLPGPSEDELEKSLLEGEEVEGTTVSDNSSETEIFGAKVEPLYGDVEIRTGAIRSIPLKVSGYSGQYCVKIGTLEKDAYKASLSKSANGAPLLNVQGLKEGEGTIGIFVYPKEDMALKICWATVSIKVVNPTYLIVDNQVELNKGGTKTLDLLFANGNGQPVTISASTDRSGLVKVSLKQESDCKAKIELVGQNPGACRLQVSMKNKSTGEEICKKVVNVTVTCNTALTPENALMAINSGDDVTTNIKVSGSTFSYMTCEAKASNTSVVSILNAIYNKSTKNIMVRMKGLNAGTSTITITLSLNGTTLATTQFTVTVKAKGTVFIKTSAKDVSLKAGGTTRLAFEYENSSSEIIKWDFQIADGYLVSCSWSNQYGNKRWLNVTGLRGGETQVTVRLLDGSNRPICTMPVKITVSSTATDILSNLSYSFRNFTDGASWDLVKFMYGTGQEANTVYESAGKRGGNCFGMAVSAELFYVPGNGVNVSYFQDGAPNAAALSEEDRCALWNLTTHQFVQCMYMTQYSYDSKSTRVVSGDTNGLDRTIREICARINQGYPEVIAVYNSKTKIGHAVNAYAFEEVSSTESRFIVYDNNYPKKTRYFRLFKDSNGKYTGWDFSSDYGSYGFTSNDGGIFSHFGYENCLNLWKNRKNTSFETSETNLLITNSGNLEIMNYKGDTIAKVEDGVLSPENDEIEQRFIINEPEGASDTVLYLPEDFYQVKNTDAELETFELSIAGSLYSANVATTADEIALCADDTEKYATAILLDGYDEAFEISIGCSIEGLPEETTWKGVGTTDIIAASMINETTETLNMGAETSVETGALFVPEEEEESRYGIFAQASEGGSISPAGLTIVSQGGKQTYTIAAEDGYEVDTVTVDGIICGKRDAYTFENVKEDHEISVTFTKKETEETKPVEKTDLKNADVTLSASQYSYDGTAKTPSVVVKANGTVVSAEEYTVRYTDNVDAGEAQVTVEAKPASALFSGSKTMSFTIKKAENPITLPKDSIFTSGSTKKKTVKINASAKAGELSYVSDLKKVKVDENGTVTLPAKFSGTVTITIQTPGDKNYEAQTRSVQITVPKAVSLTSVKNTSKGKVTVKWKKGKNVTGYQLQYALKSNFKNAKTKKIKNAKTTSAKLTKLKTSKKYYVRIRTYVTKNKKTYYSNWSSVKKVSIRK